jgi:hypothetical protein
MSATERLNAAEARLKARGVVDVKVVFDPGVAALSKNDVKNNVALVLERYLAGDFVASRFSDKHLLDPINKAVPLHY